MCVPEAGWQEGTWDDDDDDEVDGGLVGGMGRKVAAAGCKGAVP